MTLSITSNPVVFNWGLVESSMELSKNADVQVLTQTFTTRSSGVRAGGAIHFQNTYWGFWNDVWLFATPQTVACQAPLSMGFPRWKSWSWLPFSSPGDLPDTGIELASPAWQAESSPLSNQGNPRMTVISIYLLSGCSVLGTTAGIYILYILFNVVFPHNFSQRWLLLLIYLFLSMIYSIQNSKGIKIFAVSL